MPQINNLSFDYPSAGTFALSILAHAHMEVENNELVSLMGESGAGKTTLLELIAGQLSPTDGTIHTGGACISYLRQDNALLPFRTVWQNLLLAAELGAPLEPTTIAKAKQLLQQLNLSNTANDLPATLSGGMRRRIAVGRQLLREADLVLLDEPFSGQDGPMRQKLERLVYADPATRRSCTIIAMHDIDSAVALSDRIVLFRERRILSVAFFCWVVLGTCSRCISYQLRCT